MNTQITHFIQQHVSQPDRLSNICASNTRSQHVRSELVLRPPQLGGGDVLRFLIGTIAISCNETSRAFGFIRNRFGCGAANRESSIVLPSECACVCERICGCAGVFARVCVWKFVYAECKNKPHERNKERKKQQHQANHLFRVQENNKKNSAEMAKTKIESALKMLNLFIIPANRDSHWSRRGAARSEENLFICHADWSDWIDCLIDLFLHLICDARAATRNVTGASASPIDRSIDRASSIPVGVQVKLSAACGTWRSCLRVYLSPFRSCALRRGSNYVDLCTVRLHRSFDGTKSIDAVDNERNLQCKEWKLIWWSRALDLQRSSQIGAWHAPKYDYMYVDNVSVCAARCSLAGRIPLHCEREFPCERCEELR